MSELLDLGSMRDDLVAIRHDIHAHPETAFDETRTSDLVAERLGSFGLDVHRGLGGTGVVGTLKAGTSNNAIGLRADMDALFIHEANDFSYRSTNDGKMHACGHDGHTTMLLGAARYLSENPGFDGAVHFIFQPAEETGNEACGGNRMVQDGLFDKFPVSAVYGMHNFPGVPLGQFAVRTGPMLASIDTFELKVLSEHNHPATQYTSPDPIVIAGRIIEAFHGFKARGVNPAEPVVLSITQFQAGDPINDKQGVHVTPDQAYVRGTVYTLNDAVRDQFDERMSALAHGISAANGATSEFEYQRGYPVLVNTAEEKARAVAAATAVSGDAAVDGDMQPIMGAEDFAFMLKGRPGCYILMGNGAGEGTCHVHNPNYDFNDAAIPFGVSYWVKLVQMSLPEAP
ncbi:MAG: amidohydrolase [Rhodospirillaceae bacterium]|nr:amidohydrolase [Rhodospirillaceae bacterium]MBT5781357.1 amidohydrolase [Rhodospirillaceae bacterium]